ncbi:MAG: RNB domain-containing ribonuclease [Methanoregulaceae archaeon]
MKKHHKIDLRAIAWHAMEKYGFEPRFPETVIDEVNALREEPSADNRHEIRDLTSLLWSSIDNYDSLDLDQLEFCERKDTGEILVRIAIADVDSLVHKGSGIDRHAAHNGTSVYLGIVTFPMLPDRLSKGITSLLPGKGRRAIVIEYSVFPEGEFSPGTIYRARVSNKAKLVYEEIGEWLEGTTPIPESVRSISGLRDQILLQHETAQRLRQHRADQGALDLETIEAQPVVENDEVRDLILQKKNPARSLIEEFMVAANGTMVACLGNQGIPMIQRIVRTPKNWEGIMTTAAARGTTLPPQPDVKALAGFLRREKDLDPDRFPDLSLTIVKLMGAGEYAMLEPGAVPFGHFALAVTDYTHGTAPNRRYVDIIIQRLIKSSLDRTNSPYTSRELVSQAAWLTEREKGSKKAERFMRKAAAAVLLEDKTGETFDAFVTGAATKGTYVRLIAPPAEGRVIQGEQGLRVGQRVQVRLLRTDPYNGFIDFAYTGHSVR